jgi:hypothetical protein
VRIAALAVTMLLPGAPLLAQEPSAAPTHHTDAAVNLRVGTTGFGGEVAKLLTRHFAARVGGSFYSWSTTKSQTDISYDASLKLHTFRALVDFFPSGRGSFHVTGGLVTNPLTISAVGVPAASDSFKIDTTKYSASQVGTLTGSGQFKGALPYLGVGWGTPASSGGALKVLFDLGAALGKPRVALNATGAATNAQLAAEIQAQQAKTQHDVRKFLKAYPVLDLGLGYRF